MIATCSILQSTRSCISIGQLTLYKGTFPRSRTARDARMLDASHAKRQADERKRCRPSRPLQGQGLEAGQAQSRT